MEIKLSQHYNQKKSVRHRISHHIHRDWQIYTLLIPAIIAVIIFHYVPMYGAQIAFRNFKVSQGIWGSDWVGLENFFRFFKQYNFWNIIGNTIGIKIYALVLGFPIPIILALALNESRNVRYKKLVQTVSYIPHCISTVVVCGMLILFLNKGVGLINNLVSLLGGERSDYLNQPKYFSTIYVLSEIWQHTGWNSILYISALSTVSNELVEAAYIDGASRIRKIISIDLPCIMPTIIIILILTCGQLLNIGYEKILLLQTDLNIDASEVLSTYVYREGLVNGQYSYSTAIGLFNSVVSFILLLSVNWFSHKVSDTSLW